MENIQFDILRVFKTETTQMLQVWCSPKVNILMFIYITLKTII